MAGLFHPHARSRMNLLAQTLDDANLFAAWQRVRANGGAAGVDKQSIDQFEVNVFGRLLGLKHAVEKHQYRPLALLETFIPKPDGTQRRLAIPAVRDRVLQTACARILAPLLEKEFEEPSFAYRIGRSVQMAVARVAWYRDRGYRWVVDADIHTFFDEISHSQLVDKLRRSLNDHSLVPLIELWLAATVQPTQGQPYLLTRGVPQGSPISPLLANLYLDDLDEALIDRKLCLVRFADDFLILCRDRAGAEAALELTRETLDTLSLRLKPEKTRITHFDEGFRFLGVDFLRNLMEPVTPQAGPWVLPDAATLREAVPEPAAAAVQVEHVAESMPDPVEEALAMAATEAVSSDRQELQAPEEDDPAGELLRLEENPALDPLLRSLHVTRQGLTLLKENDRLIIADGREVQASIPLHKVDQIVLHGNHTVSTALLRHAMRHDIHVSFTDMAGRPGAALERTTTLQLDLLRHQFAREQQPAFRQATVREFITAKLHNSRTLLRRLNRRRNIADIDTACAQLERLQSQLAALREPNQMRGIEGAAASLYFRALRCLLPEHWQFPGRRRRPPTDPCNVLLSYGYGVLFVTVRTFLERRGLHPALGVLHSADGRHPALASDLMEEFRAPIVDAVAINALLNELQPDDFVHDETADYPCRLTDDARRRYLQWLHNKLRATLRHPANGHLVDYQRLIQAQVWHYARAVTGDDAAYRGYRMR
ncbi:MAG: hypothetical protein Kow0096_25800 [Thiohalomonadaceae bacterium]